MYALHSHTIFSNLSVQFCSTRKSTQQAAEILVKDIGSTYIKTYFQRQALQTCANSLKDNKLRGADFARTNRLEYTVESLFVGVNFRG